MAKKNLEEKQLDLQIQQAKNFNLLIEKVVPAVEKYFTDKLHKLEAPKFRWTLIVFAILLAIIVIGTGILVYFDKIESTNFIFLLGILVGAMMTLIGDIILEVKQ